MIRVRSYELLGAAATSCVMPLAAGTYLRRLTKWALKESETDQDAPEREECFVDVWSSFKADPQTAELMKPAIRSFDDPAKHAQAAAVFRVAFGEHGSNTATPQSHAMGFGIVRAIALNTLGTPPLSTFAADLGNRIHQARFHLVLLAC
jgi:hypothetical protein